MKIITKPTVTVVGHTTFLEHPVYKVPKDGTPMERLGAFAAKGCYDSYGENGRACRDNQRRIVEQRHGSVLEHLSVSLFIEGITRALSLELNRHRHFAISQRSTRYTEEEDAAIVLEPFYAELYEKHRGYFERSVFPQDAPDEAWLVYNHIVAQQSAIAAYQQEVKQLMKLNPNGLSGFELRKWARGKARNVLPHGIETRGTWTGNLRAWRHFIEVRSDRHAEPEIRRLANAVLGAVAPLAPIYFEDYTVEMVDGIPEWRTPYTKI